MGSGADVLHKESTPPHSVDVYLEHRPCLLLTVVIFDGMKTVEREIVSEHAEAPSQQVQKTSQHEVVAVHWMSPELHTRNIMHLGPCQLIDAHAILVIKAQTSRLSRCRC